MIMAISESWSLSVHHLPLPAPVMWLMSFGFSVNEGVTDTQLRRDQNGARVKAGRGRLGRVSSGGPIMGLPSAHYVREALSGLAAKAEVIFSCEFRIMGASQRSPQTLGHVGRFSSHPRAIRGK